MEENEMERTVVIKKICQKENPLHEYEGVASGSIYSGVEKERPEAGKRYHVAGHSEWITTSTVVDVYNYEKDEGKAFCPRKHFPKNINELVKLERGDMLVSTMNSIYHVRPM